MSTALATATSPLLKRSGSSCGSQLGIKRVKVESGSSITKPPPQLNLKSDPPENSRDVVSDGGGTNGGASGARLARNGVKVAQANCSSVSSDGTVIAGDASAISRSTESNSSLSGSAGNNGDHHQQQQKQQPNSEEQSQEVATPMKSTHFRHLRHKYLAELEYMLREFQKLERQLLGAKTASGSGAQESAGSRERREKLHSFIQHLEDTVQQIITGCELEAAGKTTCAASTMHRDTALSEDVTREKEEEENVQKIEEHILANLLPVKVRLKKQLAAQQGAKHNPAGMPTVRGVAMQPVANQGKATFLKQVQQQPPQQQQTLPEHQPRRPSHLGQPLVGGGSSLTQKLHGPTLSAAKPPPASPEKPKVLYGGMALGSKQMQSSVNAANTVHKLVIGNPDLLQAHTELHHASSEQRLSPTSTDTPEALKLPWPVAETSMDSSAMLPALGDLDDLDFGASDDDDDQDVKLSSAAHAAIVSYEERRKLRKRRRKKKKLLLKQQQQAAHNAAKQAAAPQRKKVVKKRQGPRKVEYTCALCNEVYNSTCDHNPWWALAQQECAKCHKQQIPRVDITAPNNAIEYHPALLAHIEDSSAAAAAAHAPESVMLAPPAPKSSAAIAAEDLESDLSDDDGLLSDGDSIFSSDSDDFMPLSPADQAENERFGIEYEGPKLADEDSCRLLTLMHHASTCPCRHHNAEQQEVCRSAKWMMLHVRDCPGTTATFDVCPFPWCRKVKHLLYHLVSCPDPVLCGICSTANLTTGMMQLQGLNFHRSVAYRHALVEKTKAAETAAKARAANKPRASAAARKPAQARVAKKPAPQPPRPVPIASAPVARVAAAAAAPAAPKKAAQVPLIVVKKEPVSITPRTAAAPKSAPLAAKPIPTPSVTAAKATAAVAAKSKPDAASASASNRLTVAGKSELINSATKPASRPAATLGLSTATGVATNHAATTTAIVATASAKSVDAKGQNGTLASATQSSLQATSAALPAAKGTSVTVPKNPAQAIAPKTSASSGASAAAPAAPPATTT